jgi:hypothetical protein
MSLYGGAKAALHGSDLDSGHQGLGRPKIVPFSECTASVTGFHAST